MKYELLTKEEFKTFYTILLNNFPRKEIKDYEYMEKTFFNGDYQILGLKDNDKIVGVLSYYQETDFYFIDYFAIDGSFKGKGTGSKMLRYFLDTYNKKVILEVEHPQDDQSNRRIAFYKRNGLVLNDQFDYFVPPVRSLKEPLYFYLMSSKPIKDNQEFEKLYPRILKLVYSIE